MPRKLFGSRPPPPPRFRTLFPYKNFCHKDSEHYLSQERPGHSSHKPTLGAGFGRNSGTRAPTPSVAFILFRPPSRQRAKLAMLFYRAAAAALAPSSWRATMPRNFFGHEHSSSSRLSPLEAPTPPDRVGISDDLPDWCPTGSSTLVERYLVHTVTKRERRSLTDTSKRDIYNAHVRIDFKLATCTHISTYGHTLMRIPHPVRSAKSSICRLSQ